MLPTVPSEAGKSNPHPAIPSSPVCCSYIRYPGSSQEQGPLHWTLPSCPGLPHAHLFSPGDPGTCKVQDSGTGLQLLVSSDSAGRALTLLVLVFRLEL